MAEATPLTRLPAGGDLAETAAPDWGLVGEPIECPLCGYNLRGLSQPQCPECGYSFDWPSLLDPNLRRHPFLFEHQPNRNLWSFWKTAVATLRPLRFWTTLRPSQPSHPGRLFLYWAMANGLPLLLGLAWATANHELIRQASSSPWGLRLGGQVNMHFKLFDSLGYLSLSVTPGEAHLHLLWKPLHFEDATDALLGTFILGAVCPWLIFLLLMIFQGSMRRARVRPIHVLRCVLYSTDMAIWVAAMLLILAGGSVALQPLAGSTQIFADGLLGMAPYLLPAALLLPFAFGAVATWRLCRAYRHYLQFDHATATVLSVQFILALALFIAGLYWVVN